MVYLDGAAGIHETGYKSFYLYRHVRRKLISVFLSQSQIQVTKSAWTLDYWSALVTKI